MNRTLIVIALCAIIFLGSCTPARVGVGVRVGPRPYYGRSYYAPRPPYYGRSYYAPRPYYNPYQGHYYRPPVRHHYRGRYR